MPTVLRFAGYRVVVYPNDHRPAHVHVIGNGREAVFILHGPKGPPTIRDNFGFSHKEAAAIAAVLAENLTALCQAWEDHHG